MTNPTQQVIIYTDGSCLGNPGKGGWAAILFYKDTYKEINGGQCNTTNNRMELTAVIEALMLLKKPCDVVIYTDSMYVKDGICSWMTKWKQNNWLTSKKEPVKNIDLWQQLEQSCSRHKISWQWIKAHNGNKHNERVDFLAKEGANKTTD